MARAHDRGTGSRPAPLPPNATAILCPHLAFRPGAPPVAPAQSWPRASLVPSGTSQLPGRGSARPVMLQSRSLESRAPITTGELRIRTPVSSRSGHVDLVTARRCMCKCGSRRRTRPSDPPTNRRGLRVRSPIEMTAASIPDPLGAGTRRPNTADATRPQPCSLADAPRSRQTALSRPRSCTHRLPRVAWPKLGISPFLRLWLNAGVQTREPWQVGQIPTAARRRRFTRGQVPSKDII